MYNDIPNQRTLEKNQEITTYLKKTNNMLKSIDKSDVKTIINKERDVVNTIKFLTMIDDDMSIDDYQSEDEKVVFIDYLENKKLQYLEIENELIDLRDIFKELYDVVKNDEHDFEIIESNIEIAKDLASQAELDVVYAQTLDDSHSTKYILLISALLSTLTFANYLFKKN
jgi:hypothetical protein